MSIERAKIRHAENADFPRNVQYMFEDTFQTIAALLSIAPFRSSEESSGQLFEELKCMSRCRGMVYWQGRSQCLTKFDQ